MVTAKECIEAIKEALKDFGEYTYYDKGASEVIEVGHYSNSFRSMTAKDTAQVLLEVLKYEHGEPFVSDAIVRLQNMPNDFWNELMSYPDLQDLY